MPRPSKSRVVCALPRFTRFGACGACHGPQSTTLAMTVDEYETIRLIDHEGLTQEDAASRMEIARTTVTSIYAEARRKLAQVLVDGVAIAVEGGNVRVCDGAKPHCHGLQCPRRSECGGCGLARTELHR